MTDCLCFCTSLLALYLTHSNCDLLRHTTESPGSLRHDHNPHKHKAKKAEVAKEAK